MQIYLDNSSTTIPNSAVIDEVTSNLRECFGNPSSIHKIGIEAEKIIKKSRSTLADALGDAKPKEIVFTSASQYLAPPMQVSHEGGVFRSKTLNRYSEEFKALEEANRKVLTNFGLQNGATHTEFIRGKADGKWYFLETSSRVGGAHIPDLVEASSGINIWREWAKIEDALLKGLDYSISKPTGYFAGLIIALIKEKHPDYKYFESEETVKFLPIDYHIGIVYKSAKSEIVQTRLDETAEKIHEEMLNIIPPKDKPTS